MQKIGKFLLTGFMQKIWKNFFAKLVQSVSLCNRLSKQLKNNQNPTTESGSKQRFTLLQEKVVIQAVCLMTQAVRIKARFFNQYFLSYVKKTTGPKLPPTPSRNRVKYINHFQTYTIDMLTLNRLEGRGWGSLAPPIVFLALSL